MGHVADHTDFVSALPGKLGAVTFFLLVLMLQMELQKCSVFLNKVRGCRDVHAQNLKRSIFLPVGKKFI